MTRSSELSDKALSVFAFAAYHQLESGDVVSSVVARDASGHQADPSAVAELVEKDLVTEKDERLHFTEAGQDVLAQLISAIRDA